MRNIKLALNLIGLFFILSTTGIGKVVLADLNRTARAGATNTIANYEQTVRKFENTTPQQPVPPRREQQGNEEPGKKTFNLMIEGALREFIIYRPANLPVNRSTPVVFAFHGTGGGGENFYEESGWREKADADGFVAVFA